MNWLNEDLKKEIRKIFEPRYKRSLTDDEVLEIAENLTDLMEAFLKMKWKQKYGP
ncbi:MAG: hypothetical protein AAB414_00815 [Patescibacteria group bacterium]